MEKETVVRPSLLSASFLHLDEDIKEAIQYGITHIHFDVMDGRFVEQISFGEPIFSQVQKGYGKEVVFDTHLMVEHPLEQVRQFALLGAEEISVHFEALSVSDFIGLSRIREEYLTLKIGLAISPETKVEEILSVLPAFDFILVMSVVPGKGGQKFIPDALDKIASLDQIRKEKGYTYTIGVDGGINDVTGPLCLNSGVDFLVAGSYYFHAQDRKEVIRRIKGL